MDDFEKLTVTDNLIKRIEALEADLRSLQMRDATATQLTEISDDAGVIRSGAFVCGDGDPLNNTDAPFTGVALLQPGIDPAGTGTLYNLVGMNAGTLEAGISATDGKLYAGGGDVVIGKDGINIGAGTDSWNSINWNVATIGDLASIIAWRNVESRMRFEAYESLRTLNWMQFNVQPQPGSPDDYDMKLVHEAAGKVYLSVFGSLYIGSSMYDVNTFLTTGWINDANTWTYASASTFTVAGDQRATFTKGTRLKWTQTTVKYGVVASSSYNAGTDTTTVTIVVNTDYTIANAAISANYFSYLDNPLNWPGWFNYTASYTGFSANPATQISRFNLVGNLCFLEHAETADGTSNANSLTVSLPVTAASTAPTVVVAAPFARDNSAQINNVSATILASGTTAALRTAGYATGWTTSGAKRAHFSATYEW